MKKLAIIVFVLSLSASSFAMTPNPVKSPDKAKIRTEISKFLTTADIYFESHDLKAMVTFTVTPKGEVVVLDVATDNPAVDAYVKSKLNYKKINFKTERQGVIYKLPLKIVKN